MHKHRQFTWPFVFFFPWLVLIAVSTPAQDGSSASLQNENELIAVLRSNASAANKAVTCKLLAIHGSEQAVPELAKLLPNEQLSSWARIALEAIPGSAADEALRNSLDSLEGSLLVGAINSIGVRRDANAVVILAKLLRHEDTDVSSAAAVALGHVGNADATKALRSALVFDSARLRSAVAEGCVLCAERRQAEGDWAEAVKIYDEVRNSDVPIQRIIEATRGAILARGQDGIPLLLEQFRSPDKSLFQLGLSTAREFPGSDVDQALADEMVRATPDRAALMIQAMADRPETVVLSAVLKAAGQGPRQVRLSAIGVLGRVGDSSCLATLLETALDSDVDLAKASRATLAKLPGENVDSEILSRLNKAKGASQVLLIEVVGQRGIDALDDLLAALDDSDNRVRSAALIALGRTVTPDNLSVLISQVLAPQHPDDAVVAQQALETASIRMPNRESCAAELSEAFHRAPVATKPVLLEILAEVGGSNALLTIGEAAKSNLPVLQDAGSRLLGKWNSMDAAPVLLDLAKKAPKEKYQIRALRGYIGIARKFTMPDRQRAEMCRQAFNAAIRLDEQKLVLDVLKRYPGTETLKLAVNAIQDPQLKREATQTALSIAQKLGGKEFNVEQLLAKGGFEKIKLEIISAEYGAGSNMKDVTAIIQKYARDLPLVTLPAPSYNASFGGDPLPGYVKQLKILYRINGKDGKATFAENALIILPPPK